MRGVVAAACGLALICGAARAARADDAAVGETRPFVPALRLDLQVDLPVDIAVTAVAGAAWGVAELLKSHLAPSQCRWCNPGFDRSIESAVVWQDAHAAITASNLGAYVAAPLVAVGLTGLAARSSGASARDFAVNLLVIAEATALAGDLNQIVKFSVGRQRPFAHAGAPNPDGSQVGRNDDNVSFYSGHTNVAFALASSAATVATMRRYRLAPLIWIAGAAVGAATAYLRMAADQHYFTDVLTGAVLGTAMGIGVPYVFHRPRRPGDAGSARDLALLPAPGGATMIYRW